MCLLLFNIIYTFHNNYVSALTTNKVIYSYRAELHFWDVMSKASGIIPMMKETTCPITFNMSRK
jgi:hypothetical protein